MTGFFVVVSLYLKKKNIFKKKKSCNKTKCVSLLYIYMQTVPKVSICYVTFQDSLDFFLFLFLFLVYRTEGRYATCFWLNF